MSLHQWQVPAYSPVKHGWWQTKMNTNLSNVLIWNSIFTARSLRLSFHCWWLWFDQKYHVFVPAEDLFILINVGISLIHLYRPFSPHSINMFCMIARFILILNVHLNKPLKTGLSSQSSTLLTLTMEWQGLRFHLELRGAITGLQQSCECV